MSVLKYTILLGKYAPILLLSLVFIACEDDENTCMVSKGESVTWFNPGSYEWRNTNPFTKILPIFTIHGTSRTDLQIYNICPTRDVIVTGELKGIDDQFSPGPTSVRLSLETDVLVGIPIRYFIPMVKEGDTWSITENIGTLSDNFDGPGNLSVQIEVITPFPGSSTSENDGAWFLSEFNRAMIRIEWTDY